MTNMLHEATQPTGPEGSIFLPNDREFTLPELDKMKFAVMQLRGDYRELTLEGQERIYAQIIAAEQSIRERNTCLGGVVLSLVV